MLQCPSAEPYVIIKFNGPNAVELELPADMMMHETVNVSRLKKYTADRPRENPPPPPVQTAWEKDDTYQCSFVVEVIT